MASVLEPSPSITALWAENPLNDDAGTEEVTKSPDVTGLLGTSSREGSCFFHGIFGCLEMFGAVLVFFG